MKRQKPSKGNIEFFHKMIDSYIAQLSHEVPADKKDEIFKHLSNIQKAKTSLINLVRLEQISPTADKLVKKEDCSANLTMENGWDKVAFERMTAKLGRYGPDAISSIGELLIYSNALGDAFGTQKLYYRGEQEYGWPLKSRAERSLGGIDLTKPGLSVRELAEIKRFQKQFKAKLPYDFGGKTKLPLDNSPLWLPIMQHYDEEFGTRLLDISSSPFAGLYFACVGWDGLIDTSTDGIVYCFVTKGMLIRGCLLYTSPSPRDATLSRMPSSA